MAEVHILGQITEAKDFPKQSLFCKWHLQTGNNWKVISGKKDGQTQVSCSEFDDICRWSFPIDIHLATAGIQGWPKIFVQVYHLDWLGRSHIFGYGFITIPTTPGVHTLDCYTWRPFEIFLTTVSNINNYLRMRKVRVIGVVVIYFLLQTGNSLGINNTSTNAMINTTKNPIKSTTTSSTTNSILTSTQTTTCQDNSSCLVSNVTKIAMTTTSIPSILSNTTFNMTNSTQLPTTTIAPKTMKKFSSKNSKNDICICDLKINYCDINCCCDNDCTIKDKEIFTDCEEEFHYYDTRFCDYMKHIYINKTQHEWQISQNDLFCLVRTNYSPNRLIQRKQPLKTFEEAENERKSMKYSWPIVSNFEENKLFSNMANNYTYGQEIWIISNNSLSNLLIPNSLISNACLAKEKIKFLIDLKTVCVQTNLSEENEDLYIESYYKNISIIAAPNLWNSSKYEERIWQCPKNICLPIEPYFCNINYENCVKITTKNQNIFQTIFNRNKNSSVTNPLIDFRNVVRKIKYNFHHEGNRGLKKIQLYLLAINLTINNDKNLIKQEFEINFLWINKTLNYSSYLSGNPGYLIGKPILIANLIRNFNETLDNKSLSSSDNVSKILFRNSKYFSENFLSLPDSNSNGLCILNRNKYLAIEFGYNLLNKCEIKGFVENYPRKNNTKIRNKENPKYICELIQKNLFEYWLLINKTDDNESSFFIDKFVGQFGNANIYKKDDWIPIFFNYNPSNITNSTWGSFNNQNTTLNCYNITTLLAIDIYYSRIDFDNVLNQIKILGVSYRFENFRNFSFNYNSGLSNFTNFSIVINNQVMFYDITKPKIRKLVDPPSLNIQLPYDFFYPFIKLGNNSCSRYDKFLSLNIIFVCVLIVLSFF